MSEKDDTSKQTTEYPVAEPSCCDAIEQKYKWEQAAPPKLSGDSVLPWLCTFKGDVQFPKPYSEIDSDG